MSPRRRPSPRLIFTLAACAIGVVLYSLVYCSTTWPPYGTWLAAAGGTTFLLYGWDKLQAIGGGLRVPKIVLHGLALAGGVLGGWAGMLVFRHKRRQGAFWGVLLLSTLLHGALAYYWLIGK
jgi:uncharacterized membrane protein YsdA (DUF1294 family)